MLSADAHKRNDFIFKRAYFMSDRIYFDHAATTPIDESILRDMFETAKECYGNPSAVYSEGVFAKRIVYEARSAAAKALGAYEKEIIFTSGGSEADNLALIGVMKANKDKGRHLITTSFEHKAVLESAELLKKEGFRVTYIEPKANGIIDVNKIESAICSDTVLISVMSVNNELGTIQPIEEIGKLSKERNVYFHTDAVQAFGKLDINPSKLGIDLLSTSGHKIGGPKGTGFLYVKRGTRIESLIHGGSQEYGLRAGTENVIGLLGLKDAIEASFYGREEKLQYVSKLTESFRIGLEKRIDGIEFNNESSNTLPGFLSVSFDGIEGSSLLIQLDIKGLCASSGSACTLLDDKPSHVLKAIGLTDERIRSAVRFSLGADNTPSEVKRAIEIIGDSVEYLRKIKRGF